MSMSSIYLKTLCFTSLFLMIFFLFFTLTFGLERLPDLKLMDTEGRIFNLNDYIGKKRPAVLIYIDTDCPACKNLMETVKNIKFMFGERVTIISITVDPINDDIDKLRVHKEESKADWVFAIPVVEDVAEMLNIIKQHKAFIVPTVAILDEDGYVRARFYGIVAKDVLYTALVKLTPPDYSLDFQTIHRTNNLIYFIAFTSITIMILALMFKKFSRIF